MKKIGYVRIFNTYRNIGIMTGRSNFWQVMNSGESWFKYMNSG